MHSYRSHRHPVRARWIALLRFSAVAAGINAAASHAGTQRPAPLTGPAQAVIKQFLSSQAVGLPGKVVITIDTPMSGALPPCDAPEPFLPSGAKIWGRVSVGIRCNGAAPAAEPATASPGRQAWSRYVPAYVAVIAPYLVATRPIDAGETLTAADFTLREGDLTTLPRNILTGTAQIDGMVALNRLAAGAPVRPELLRGAVVIQPGQNVKVMAQGAGFVASTEGRAMTGAAIGARLQVKTQGGQMVVGIVRADGSVELLN